MTRDEAAALLRCTVSSSRADIERAYRTRARETHPDRFAGQSTESIARAAAEFSRVADAYAVLIAAPVVSQSDRPAVVAPPPYPRAYVLGWTAVLALGIFLSVTGDARLLGDIELYIRLAALVVGLVGYAFTGRRAFRVLAIIALAVTVAFTLAAAGFGTLLALLVIGPSALALLLAGRRRATGVTRPRG